MFNYLGLSARVKASVNPAGGHEQVVQIRRASVHENYEKGAKVDNIALLVLQPELKFNEFVQNIPIRKDVPPTGIRAK
ncbi:unnamed protein product [Allacma fusca]|uniref:Peptidase S1 domain-containing protein n=1 Tax=Allacma fusca TaxID=39272 RepID=A0A8J2JZF4_9HEXA|nr:unnamed protein product [Allacma fusca]